MRDTTFDNAAEYTLIMGGGTLRGDGALWFPTTGYMVGGAVPTRIVGPLRHDVGARDIAPHIARFAAEYADYVNGIPRSGIGTWLHGGLLHLDVSINVETLHDALALGRARGEIAIWDCAHGEEIPCATKEV